MNKSQQNTLNDFIAYKTRLFGYEVKELRVTEREDDTAIYVSITTGCKDDEGTMAEFICRDTYCFFIGARGGMFQYGKGINPTYCNKYTVKTLF